MTKRQLCKIDKILKQRMDGIAKERDKLDDAISELSELKEHADEAYDDLQRARDSLSRLV